MHDGDIDVVLRSIKKIIQQWPVPLMERLADGQSDPFKILIACILSLRTRDSVVEKASTQLFSLAGDSSSLARLSVKKIEKAIYPVSFYRIKAKQIQVTSKRIVKEFGGTVPDEIEVLLALPGVGRKTANLVRTVGYAKAGICVDVHVHRISRRLGYVTTKCPDDTEIILRKKLPKKYWIGLNGLLVPFGQYQCTPVSPRCSSCPIRSFCNQVGVLNFR